MLRYNEVRFFRREAIMAQRKHTRVVTLAIATATPSILTLTPANASPIDQVPTQYQSLNQESDPAARAEARKWLMAELMAMSPAEKAVLAAERLPRADVIIVAAKNTAANCSNPCRKTLLLCPHKTKVTGGCPTLPPKKAQ
jgi:hypothetical protein